MARACLAAAPGDEGAGRRSLVLAGGGMRVAYQAGVLAALDEEGLRFHHVDGTSGGTINLSMLLTGQGVDEMCDRWRGLDPRDFCAPLPWSDYLRSPHWPGLGGGNGIRDKVFPQLGIDPVEIRKSDGVTGTYNICNFATKTVEVLEHTEVDEDLLVAAISLPVLMPAVERDGIAYTDAVWIRDSNVPEAARRGSDEVWLVWCLGNTVDYERGLFRQYVHMIEMAANGSLLGDLDHLAGDAGAAGLRLHVIKPSRPIPLDPDFLVGRVDAAGLIGMGYRDARAYLRRPGPLTAPWGPDVSQMRPSRPGVATRLVASDRSGGLGVHLRLEAPTPAAGAVSLVMDATGDVSVPGLPAHRLVEEGTVTFEAGGVRMDLRLGPGTGSLRLTGATVADGIDVTVHDGGDGRVVRSGALPFGPAQAARTLTALHATGAPSWADAWRARASTGRAVWRAGRR
ncbi:MAG: patatin-like phospholipase family protein [Acidimicrobiales bacterium]